MGESVASCCMVCEAKLAACAAGGAPWPNGEPGPGDHLRKVFYRMGLDDKEIVALSGKLNCTSFHLQQSQACIEQGHCFSCGALAALASPLHARSFEGANSLNTKVHSNVVHKASVAHR